MSDAFYIDIRDNTVDPLIAEFGTTYTVVTPGTYDKFSMTTGVETRRDVLGLVSDGSFVNSLVNSEGANNQWVSQRVLLLTASAAVTVNEKIIVDAVEHDLSKVEKIQPANVNVLYVLDLSR